MNDNICKYSTEKSIREQKAAYHPIAATLTRSPLLDMG